MNDPFWFFPDDIILNIALLEDIEGIPNLCKSSPRLNNLICNNEEFWKKRFINDFDLPLEINQSIILWKEAYDNYGKVFSFGENKFGQLGIGSNKKMANPIQVSVPKSKFIACGDLHTMVIDMKDNLWAFGNNESGQLGIGHIKNTPIPTLVYYQEEVVKAKMVACGDYHTAVITTNNDVLICGRNSHGQIGLDCNQDLIFPQFKLFPFKAKFVACGAQHTMIIDMNDDVWSCGNNQYGQLGIGLGNQRTVIFPEQVPNIKGKFIACGTTHTVIIDTNDNVHSCGGNGHGQLGLNNNVSRWNFIALNLKAKFIACGWQHTLLINMNDDVTSFGRNNFKQLGLPDNLDRNIPTQLELKAKYISCARDYTILTGLDNKTWFFGKTTNNLVLYPSKLGYNTLMTACGENHTIMILAPNQRFNSNVHHIHFTEAIERYNEFINFNFLSEYQIIPHNPMNYIASFYTQTDVYLVELQYNQVTNQIGPPLL